MKTVSLIVPVYNTEKYLRQCVDSILSQTYKDLEVILVDDGSTDSSGKICDEYKIADIRIKVLHKSNGGLSSARNAGMEIATGEYLSFVDSDDYLKNDYVERLLEALENVKGNNKGVFFSFCDVDSTRYTFEALRLREKKYISRNDFIKCLSDTISKDYVLEVVAWNKLFLREDLNSIRFSEGRIHEDEFFINEVIKIMEGCIFVSEKLYIYRVNEEGITGNKNKFSLRHLDAIDAYGERVVVTDQIGEKEVSETTARNGLYKLCRMYLDAKEESKDARKGIADKYKEFYRNFAKYMRLKKRVKYALFLINPAFSKLICK